ncbi:MAG: RNA polymerase subunit sigma, partial [Candidatus Thermoplasmatota archaeon]|nr:RNA polymerase subunit sigma [Candidatus Thermoplasmatota archaeon]
MDKKKIQRAVDLLRSADHVTVFTGAGISVESGIPPFRGEDGIWNTIDPQILELNYFFDHPLASWRLIKKIFYDTFKNAEPNTAHKNIATLESMGIVKSVITQNIDNLHQRAGSKNVIEFHGNSRKLVCLKCLKYVEITEDLLDDLPPRCPYCLSVLKPDFVFFGESIPDPARSLSFQEADLADVFLLIGTTG